MAYEHDIIVALSTPPGTGAIAVIRVSGGGSIELVDGVFFGKNLTKSSGGRIYYGKIKGRGGVIVDECMTAVYRSPRSYTREDSVEISCHGSTYIVEAVIRLILSQGARLAEPGEFTMRAFLNGQLDLAQAEAVADLIASQTETQHTLAMAQLRGGITKEISSLRGQLLQFAGLIELENDFSEEDVEFADRTRLVELGRKLLEVLSAMRDSFKYGHAIKKGVPVAIVGKPNVGKSTLLNQLLGDDKAIVSPIPGTTRDVIEDTLTLDGILFRFVDTAGLRDTTDEVELMGIARSYRQVEQALIVLYMMEIEEDAGALAAEFGALNLKDDQRAIILLNKTDLFHKCHRHDVEEAVSTLTGRNPTHAISAEGNLGLDKLREDLVTMVQDLQTDNGVSTVSNLRHFESLSNASESMQSVLTALEQDIPSDLIALDIRHTLHHLGTITGEISTDDILGEIFSNFCIGK